MKKFLPFLILLFLLGSLSASAELIGCRTHAGEWDENGVLHLYGCSEHGETFPEGIPDIACAWVQDHCTVLLHRDGTVSLHGLHSFPQQDVESWQGMKQLIAHSTYLIGLKDGSIAETAFSAYYEPNPEYGEETSAFRLWLEEREGEGNLAGIAVGNHPEQMALLMQDGSVFFAESSAPVPVLQPGETWDDFSGLLPSGNERLFLLKGNTLEMYESGKRQVLQTGVKEFAATSEVISCLTEDGRLLFASLWNDPAAWRNTLNTPSYEGEETKFTVWEDVEKLAGMFGYNAIMMVHQGKVTGTGYIGESAPFPYWEEDMNRWPIAACRADGDYLVVKYENGTYASLSMIEDAFTLSTFGPAFPDVSAFLTGGGPEKQLEMREQSLRLAHPYAVLEDGSLGMLNSSLCEEEVLGWENIAGISADPSGRGNLVAAVTKDGRVYTYCREEGTAAAASAREAAAWTDMAQITVYHDCIAGVTRDGRVRVAGNVKGSSIACQWTDAVSAVLYGGIHSGNWDGETHLACLRRDGTVLGDMYGVQDVVFLSGCNRLLTATHMDGTVTVWGWNFQQDCLTKNTQNVRCALFPDEFYAPGYIVTNDGKVYNSVNDPSEDNLEFSAEDGVKARMIFYTDYGLWMLCDDGSLRDEWGDQWEP